MAIKKSFSLVSGLVALQIYHKIQESKNSFSLLGKASLAIGETETEFLLKIARETNLILAAREARATPHKHWAALSAALQNRAEKSESFFLVSLYSEARTFFEENF